MITTASASSIRSGLSRRSLLSAIGAAGALVVTSSCSAPGSTTSAASDSAPVATGVGSDPVTLNLTVGNDEVPALNTMGAAFQKKFPNVTVKVTGQDFITLISNTPRLLAGSGAPDIIRLGSFGNLVKNGLITSLDPWAKAYGWDEWPQSQFASLRSETGGTIRGKGSLFGAGPGYGLTGLWYDKRSMTALKAEEPTTVEELETLFATAQAAGIQPMVVNTKDGALAYLIENLAIEYAGNADAVQAWNYDQQGANINTPEVVRAAKTVQDWVKRGFVNADTNSLDGTAAASRFAKGGALFFPSGNWQAPTFDEAMAGQAGFMLFPPAEAGGNSYAMSASLVLAVSSASTKKNAAAAFINFVQTDATARQAILDQAGLVPAGPADAPVPQVAAGSAKAAVVEAFSKALTSDGLVEFMNNATASMATATLTPQLQLLAAGQTTPQAFAAKLQSDYESDLKR